MPWSRFFVQDLTGDILSEFIGKSTAISVRILISILAIIGVWITRKIVLNVVHKRVDDARKRYQWKKITGYVAFGLNITIFMMGIWSKIATSVMTLLGLLTAGIAIALRDVVMAVAGWIFIITRRPFEVGDRIELGSVSGDVVDIRSFQFTMVEIGNWVDADQSTGRIIHVPNEKIFKEECINYTQTFRFIWHEIPVTITFESDWKKAKRILTEILNKTHGEIAKTAEHSIRDASKQYMIYYSKLTPIVYTTIRDSGIMLTMRYLCRPQMRRNSEEEIVEMMLTRFGRQDDIDFAYNTMRAVVTPVDPDKPEGFPGKRPKKSK
jgi:small-conductance mechanosensitive channel